MPESIKPSTPKPSPITVSRDLSPRQADSNSPCLDPENFTFPVLPLQRLSMISFHFIFKDWVNANLLPPDFILSIEPIAVIKAEGNEMDVEQRDVEKSCLIRVRSQRLLYNCPKSASNTYFLTGRRGRDSYFYVNEEIQLKTGEIIKVTMNSNRSYSIRISSSTAV